MKRTSDFKCHICGQTFYGYPAIQLTLIGFNWNPEGIGEDAPGWLYDLCPLCREEFCRMYQTIRENRLREIEAQKNELFKSGLMLNGDPSRKTYADAMSGAMSAHSPSLNYAKSEPKHPARLYRSTEKQKCWRF